MDAWNRLANPQPAYVGSALPRVIGVDRAPVSKVWAICGAQYVDDGAAHVEIGFSQHGSLTEVVEKLIGLVTEADPVALVIDSRSPAAVLKPLLVEAGIEPVMTNLTDLAIACEGFLEGVIAEKISHSAQQILTDSVGVAAKKELPGGRFTWESSGGGTIVQLMAATLAHWGLLTYSTPPVKVAAPVSGGDGRGFDRDSGELDPLTAAF